MPQQLRCSNTSIAVLSSCLCCPLWSQDFDAPVNSISYHRTEDLLAAASDDDTIHIFDTAQGLIKGKTPSKKYGCACVTWTHSPYTLVFASNKVGHGSCRLQAVAAKQGRPEAGLMSNIIIAAYTHAPSTAMQKVYWISHTPICISSKAG